MLETASRIHSANGGVRASQARDCEAAAFIGAASVSGAILVNRPSKSRRGATRRPCRFEELVDFTVISLHEVESRKKKEEENKWFSFVLP